MKDVFNKLMRCKNFVPNPHYAKKYGYTKDSNVKEVVGEKHLYTEREVQSLLEAERKKTLEEVIKLNKFPYFEGKIIEGKAQEIKKGYYVRVEDVENMLSKITKR